MQYVDHKHFMSKKTRRNFPLSTDRSQTYSLPLLLSLLGNGKTKAKSATEQSCNQQQLFPGSQHYASNNCHCPLPAAERGGLSFSLADLSAQTQEPQPLAEGTSFEVTGSESPKTLHPNANKL